MQESDTGYNCRNITCYDPAYLSNKYLEISHAVLLEYFYLVYQGKWVWVNGVEDPIFRHNLYI